VSKWNRRICTKLFGAAIRCRKSLERLRLTVPAAPRGRRVVRLPPAAAAGWSWGAKAERFNKTLLSDRAYVRRYNTNQARLDALPGFVDRYNHLRPARGLRNSDMKLRRSSVATWPQPSVRSPRTSGRPECGWGPSPGKLVPQSALKPALSKTREERSQGVGPRVHTDAGFSLLATRRASRLGSPYSSFGADFRDGSIAKNSCV
jgi:hypothetical protein